MPPVKKQLPRQSSIFSHFFNKTYILIDRLISLHPQTGIDEAARRRRIQRHLETLEKVWGFWEIFLGEGRRGQFKLKFFKLEIQISVWFSFRFNVELLPYPKSYQVKDNRTFKKFGSPAVFEPMTPEFCAQHFSNK